MSWFYDDADSGSGPIREIERIYCFLFDSFSKSDWATLSQIYDNLPSPQAFKPVPYWFGTAETDNYLWASIEPPGLQVVGRLHEANWLAWTEAFHEQVQNSSLPLYEFDMQ